MGEIKDVKIPSNGGVLKGIYGTECCRELGQVDIKGPEIYIRAYVRMETRLLDRR